jgi:pimeloyl-ACP methyl ester carboxylesterase
MLASSPLYARRIGSGGPLVVLIHGLDANGDVWDPLIAEAGASWPGRFLVPDLRGHGRSFHRAPYGYASYAADIADLCEQDEEIIVVGHSLGGVVAVALATGWFGVPVRHALAIGVKVRWSEDEIARTRALAKRPPRRFGSRDEAIDWYLKVSGLAGLVAADSTMAAGGIRADGNEYQLASDQRIYAATGPDVGDFVGVAKAPISWAAGTKDPMVTTADLTAFTTQPELIEGGHNVHVEQPAQVWRLVQSLISQ